MNTNEKREYTVLKLANGILERDEEVSVTDLIESTLHDMERVGYVTFEDD